MAKDYKILSSRFFDVLLPVRNAEKYVEQAIESVLNSSHKMFRLILLDDASTDASYERLLNQKQKDERILLLRNERSLGFEKTLRRLLTEVSSQIFFFMRPEDVLSPYFMALAEQAFRNHDADVVYHVPFFCDDGNTADSSLPKFPGTDRIAVSASERACFFNDSSLWNRIYRSKFFFDKIDALKGISESECFFSSRLLNYCTVSTAERIVELPDKIYSRFVERKNVFYENDFGPMDLLKSFPSDSQKARCLLQDEKNWPEFQEPFYVGELFELIRIYKNCRNQSNRFAEALTRFREIGNGMDEDQRSFYSDALLPEHEDDFIQNILSIAKTKKRQFPVSSVPLAPCSGKITLSAPNHEVYYDCDLFTVLSWNVGAGYLAIDGLGYGTPLSLPEHLEAKHLERATKKILSAHSPSTVRVHLKKRTLVQGVLNGTSRFSLFSGCRFYVDDQYIGRATGPTDETKILILEPGFYDFRIESFQAKGLHSLWILSESLENVQKKPEQRKIVEKNLRNISYRPLLESETTYSYYPIGILTDTRSTDIGAVLYNYALQLETRDRNQREFIDVETDFARNHPTNSSATNFLPEHSRSVLKSCDVFRNEYFDFSSRCLAKQDFERNLEKYRQLRVHCDSRWLAEMKSDNPIFPLDNLPKKILTNACLRLPPKRLKQEIENEKILVALQNFGSITVPDRETVEILHEKCLNRVDQAIDVLFMPEKRDWVRLADRKFVPNNPYLFVHFVSEHEETKLLFERIREKTSLEIVFFPAFDLSERFVHLVSSISNHTVSKGPREFLGLLENADFVLTDNYHGVAFSMIFEKAFHCLENQAGDEPNVESLLERFGFSNRMKQKNDGIICFEKNQNYRSIKEQICKERKKRMFSVNQVKSHSDVVFQAGEPSIVNPRNRRDNDISILYDKNISTSRQTMSFDCPEPDFTVCVPVYNAVSFLDDAIESVLRSTHKNFKLLLSDNCSTDGSVEKLKHWAKTDSRIIVLLNDENIGVSGNVLRCVPYINTPFVVWLDADDMLSPYYMDVCKKEFERHDADAVFFQTIFIDAQGNFLQGGTKHGQMPTWHRKPSEKSFLFSRPASCDKMWDQRRIALSCYYNKKNSQSGARAHMDVAANLQTLSQCEKIVSVPNALYYRRIHENSITERTEEEIQLDAVDVFDLVKRDYERWGVWNEYREIFYRYKLNHLIWLYTRLPEALQGKLVSKMLASMDREERWFFRRVRLRKEHRMFVDMVLGLEDFKSDSDNFYPDPVPLDLSNDNSVLSSTVLNPSSQACFENEFLAVHTGTVGKGRLGINELGYGNPLSLPAEVKLISHTVLSAPCPSRIKISFKRPVGLRGFMNGTSSWSHNSSCLFQISGCSAGGLSVDDLSVGCLFGPGDVTDEMIFPPGTYELETSGLESSTKHSAWAIRETKDVPKDRLSSIQKPHHTGIRVAASRSKTKLKNGNRGE